MVSLRTTYWMTVGVLALVLGNSLVSRHEDWTRCLADRSVQIADRFSARALTLAARAQTAFNRGETSVSRAQTRLALVQARVASRQARIQTIRIRTLTAPVVVCPRVSVPTEDSI